LSQPGSRSNFALVDRHRLGRNDFPTIAIVTEYRALYRKYRPQRFSDVIGQGHVTETLSSEVQSGRVAHAYLFAGPRGTGKTSTARILAKALNCTDRGADGEPCSVCDSCRGIIESSSMDVIELDAASHNKVEDVREIRANVGTVASAGGARRVYILDEAHMLSRAASNALLKTLEEPPEHAHFVLATTEPYKLPDTIRSRTQRFDFHPIGSEALVGHLSQVALAEGLEASHEALALIVRHASGSARDALGLLEQVGALGGGSVDSRGVIRALGLADADAFAGLIKAVADESAADGLSLIASLVSEGADLRRFVSDSIEFLRGVFLAQYAPNLEEIVDETAEVLEEWRSHGRTLSPGDVLRCIDRLGAALLDLREGREERLVVELAMLQMTRPETAPDLSSLAARLDRLEERMRLLAERGIPAADESGSTIASQPVAVAPVQDEPPVEPTIDEPAPDAVEEPESGPDASQPPTLAVVPDEPLTEEPESAVPEAATELDRAPTGVAGAPDLGAVDAAWPSIMARVREDAGMRRHALFREARPTGVEGDRLILEVPDHLPFHLAQLGEDDRLNEIVAAAASAALGTTLRLEYRAGAASSPKAERQPDPEPVRAPDKDQLLDEGEAEIDPAGLVIDLLGGEIISDD
jgi:DNA polymerase-3 subunit gamma/tau